MKSYFLLFLCFVFLPNSQARGLKKNKNFPVEKPALIGSCKPEYPKYSLRNEETGIVQVSVIVGADGNVAEAKIVIGKFKNLNEAVLDTVNNCKFTPGRIGGRAAKMETSLQFDFTMDDPVQIANDLAIDRSKTENTDGVSRKSSENNLSEYSRNEFKSNFSDESRASEIRSVTKQANKLVGAAVPEKNALVRPGGGSVSEGGDGGIYLVEHNEPYGKILSLVSASNAEEAINQHRKALITAYSFMKDEDLKQHWRVIGGCKGTGWGALVTKYFYNNKEFQYGWTCAAKTIGEAIRIAWDNCNRQGSLPCGGVDWFNVSVGRGGEVFDEAIYGTIPRGEFTQSHDWGYLTSTSLERGMGGDGPLLKPEDVISRINKMATGAPYPFFITERNFACINHITPMKSPVDGKWATEAGEKCLDPSYGTDDTAHPPSARVVAEADAIAARAQRSSEVVGKARQTFVSKTAEPAAKSKVVAEIDNKLRPRPRTEFLHDPLALANHCVSLDFRNVLYGGFKNSCNQKISYGYCVFHPKKGSWTDTAFFDCERDMANKSEVGGLSIKPFGADTEHTNGGERVFWFACFNGASAEELHFNGTEIRGKCIHRE